MADSSGKRPLWTLLWDELEYNAAKLVPTFLSSAVKVTRCVVDYTAVWVCSVGAKSDTLDSYQKNSLSCKITQF